MRVLAAAFEAPNTEGAVMPASAVAQATLPLRRNDRRLKGQQPQKEGGLTAAKARFVFIEVDGWF
jgi:hypothetical protein